jgi:beta-phosphoglucomutase-like phosphatase (HAD superfamily)
MLVLLDVDGTLVDTNYLHVDAWARAFHALGLVVPRAAIGTRRYRESRSATSRCSTKQEYISRGPRMPTSWTRVTSCFNLLELQ